MTEGHAATESDLAARMAIADLIHVYARHVRRDEPDLVSALFTPDATYEIRSGHPDRDDYVLRSRLEGHDGIDAHIGAGKGKPHPVPLIHNLIVEVDGDGATANCVMEAQIFQTGQKVCGEYHDTFRRVEGRWYFASRVYLVYSEASTV